MTSGANHRLGIYPEPGKNRQESHPTRKRLGFTLVELLVTIAIIAILAALLTPVVGKMIERARESTCVSNLKQLSVGAALYCGDHDGAFPDSTDYIPPNPPPYGVPNYQFWVPLRDLGYVTHSGYASNKGAYFCPSNLANRILPWPKQGWTTYGYNVNLIGQRRGSVSKKIALLMDSYNELTKNADPVMYGSRYGNPWQQNYGVHRGGQNVAFVDGHVEWVNLTPHPTGTMAKDSDCVDMKAAWFWPLN